jgi:cytoskeleton protein RodZ
MKLTGQKLREKREQVHLTIGEVSLATKINPKVLNAMEAGDSLHLPAKTFLRGFVRSYAGYLKMNVDEVLVLFSEETGEVPKEATAVAPAENSKDTTHHQVELNGEGSNTFRMVVVGSVLVLIVMIIGVRALIQKYERERAIESSAELTAGKIVPLEKTADDKSASATTVAVPAGENGAATAATPASVLNPEGRSDREAVATVLPLTSGGKASSAFEKKTEVKFEDKSALKVDKSILVTIPTIETKAKVEDPHVEQPKIKSPEVEAKRSAAATETKPEIVAVKEPKKAVAAKAEEQVALVEAEVVKAKIPGKEHHEIILEALDRVDVKFALNGQSHKVSLSPNQVHTIVAEGPVTLEVSDGGAVNITDNGHDKGPAGDLGQPKQVSIP